MPEKVNKERPDMKDDQEHVQNTSQIRQHQAEHGSNAPPDKSPRAVPPGNHLGNTECNPDDPLIADLEADDWSVRKAAAAALGKIGNNKAVKPLISALKDESREVRTAAASALGKIGDHQAMKPLVGLLKDVHRDVRTAAVESLAMLFETGAAEDENEISQEMVCPIISSGYHLVFCREGYISRTAYVGTNRQNDPLDGTGEIPFKCAGWSDGQGCTRLKH